MNNSAPNNFKPRRSRYDITAFNVVGSDPAGGQWWLGNNFNQQLLAAEDSGHTTDLVGATLVDEALNLFGKELFDRPTMGISAIKRAVTMGRFLGRPFLAGSQTYTGLAKYYANNNSIIVALQNHDIVEAAAVARAVGHPADRAGEIKDLKKGECFIWCAGWPQCIKATYPFLDFGDYPSAEEVNAKLSAELNWVRSRNVYATYPHPSASPIDFRAITGRSQEADPPPTPLLDQQFRFMQSMRDHPNDGLMAHYARTKVSREFGNHIVRDLKAAGYIRIMRRLTPRSTGGAPLKVAYLTPLGDKTLKAHENRTKK